MTQFAPLLPFALVLILLVPSVLHAVEYSPPPIMLAKTLVNAVDYSQYSISEKLDGVRVYWNGEKLLTRSGRSIEAPDWFVEGLPSEVVDGELWLGRGEFDRLSGLVRSTRTEDETWRRVRFMAFDLPSSVAPFSARSTQLQTLVADQNTFWFRAVERRQLSTQAQVDDYLTEIVAKGGEGLMLNRLSASYESQRSDAILKLKPRYDDEAQVIEHIVGNGKFTGLMGSVVVEWQGRQFRIGSGFSLDDRKQPPVVGSQITFEYSGLTSTGLPRFARYIRAFSEE